MSPFNMLYHSMSIIHAVTHSSCVHELHVYMCTQNFMLKTEARGSENCLVVCLK